MEKISVSKEATLARASMFLCFLLFGDHVFLAFWLVDNVNINKHRGDLLNQLSIFVQLLPFFILIILVATKKFEDGLINNRWFVVNTSIYMPSFNLKGAIYGVFFFLGGGGIFSVTVSDMGRKNILKALNYALK